jgi:Flp pilus assembly protein TadD
VPETTWAAITAALEHQRGGDLVRAEQAYRHILQTDPGRAEALHGLAELAYRRGDYGQAIAWLRQAVAGQPTNPLLHSNLGAAYLAAGQPAEAEACCRQALRLQPVRLE